MSAFLTAEVPLRVAGGELQSGQFSSSLVGSNMLETLHARHTAVPFSTLVVHLYMGLEAVQKIRAVPPVRDCPVTWLQKEITSAGCSQIVQNGTYC
jgi:hypothetical protein